MSENVKLDIYLFSLSNVQKIITRLSNIGYVLFTITLTMLSIISSITFSLSLGVWWKFAISLISLCLVLIFFGVNIANLKNEKAFIEIYNEKTKINIDETSIEDILTLKSFNVYKKDIKNRACITSFLTWMWIAVSFLPLAMLGYSIFLIYCQFNA